MKLDGVIEKITGLCCSQGQAVSDATIAKPDKTVDVLDATKTDAESETSTPEVPNIVPEDMFSGKETKFELHKWKDLPSEAKKAAEGLGFHQEMWDTAECPDSEWKFWEDLTEAEREAAGILGWEKKAWDDKYEEDNFCDIPDHVKRAAKSLGFDETMWDEGRWPDETKHKYWDELTNEEKAAYAVFGYTKNTWD